MMAKYIFIHYLGDVIPKVTDFTLKLLEKHINDEENKDNSALIEQKQGQIIKLSKRLDGLIDMRADGEITKEVFNEKSAAINAEIDKLQNEITELLPQPKTEEDDDPLYEDKLTVLKHYIKNIVDFENIDRIPDNVIKAFVRKMVVHENSIDWYLRFGSDPDSPKSVNVKGKKGKAEILETDKSTPTLECNRSGCNRRQIIKYLT